MDLMLLTFFPCLFIKLMRNNTFSSHHHCIFNLTFHVIFVTKFRKCCLNQFVLNDIYEIIPKIAKSIGVEIQEIKGESEHIHFILSTKPNDCLAFIIGCLKSKSSSFLVDKYNFPYWGKHKRTLWSGGYFISSTGGVSIDVLEKYIQNQGL